MGFIHLKSQDCIISIDDISMIDFDQKDESDEDDEANLTIHLISSSYDPIEITGEEAEHIYLEIIKRIPDLTVIS